MSTVSQWPASMASAAAPTKSSNDAPPSIVEDTHEGWIPQYSAIDEAENRSTPVVARPSTSAKVRPASAKARVAAWVWSS